MESITDIRPSPLAGRWYPAQPNELAQSVDSYINSAKIPDLEGEVIALVSPHAGHIYSGPVAGYAFKTIKGLSPDLVLILSPYHDHHDGAVLTSGHQAYQTPLGEVPVDHQALERIEKSLQEQAGTGLDRVRNDREHAVEILLPFFQRTLTGPFRIAPLMIRTQNPDLIRKLGAIAAEIIRSNNALLAASTDLSHFFPANKARVMDQVIIQAFKELSPEALFEAQKNGTGAACGLAALAAVIWASRESGDVNAHHLKYADSGDITGDKSSVVGYTSGVITRR